MVKLKILIPDATVNYVTNPALRYDTTGWNAQGATLSRVLTRARFGVASLKIVTAGSALHEGAYFRVSSLSGVSEPITVSAYVRGAGAIRIRMDNNVVGGTEFYSPTFQLDDDRWHRISVSGFSTGGNDIRLFVETDEAVAAVRTFYVDGAQVERKSYATTYCDGDQEGCRWNGVYHASTSQRGVDTRAGGRWAQLAGEEREAEDLYMTVVGGLGAAPLTNNTQNFAQAAGGFFSNLKVNMRVATLTFHAKHTVEGEEQPVSLEHLHELRQMLIDVVKPDKTGGNEDIYFEYDDGNRPVYFRARYDGGLEGDWDIRNQFINSFPLRLLGVSPFMEEDSQEALEVDFQDTISNNFMMGRVNGRWNRMNYGMNDDVQALAQGPRGQIYAGGVFSVVNNNAAALDPLRTARVAYWDGEKWVALATSLTVGAGVPTINTIAVAPNGYVYVGGNFTNIHGVAANYIAYWNGTTWNAMSTGLDAQCHQIDIAPNGDIYAVGEFNTAGGVQCWKIARWDGSQWRRVGQYGGLNNTVICISIDKTGDYLYVGGGFTDQQGNPGSGLTGVAKYNVSTGLFSAMGSGITTSTFVYAIKVSRSGIVYAGGSFLLSGSTTVNNICYWNGTTWNAMGEGFGLNGVPANARVRNIDLFDNGNVLATGFFTNSGSLPVFGFALWNGSVWTPLDTKSGFNNANYPYVGIVNNDTDDIFVGYLLTTSPEMAPVAGITTVNNPGSASVKPDIYLKGSGICYFIENQSTKKRIYLNLTLAVNEEVVIDLQAGTIKSNTRGDVLFSLLAGSDFRSWELLPDDNVIAAFMANDVGATMSMQFEPRHWSADATGTGEEL